jgi:hypothetical protein
MLSDQGDSDGRRRRFSQRPKGILIENQKKNNVALLLLELERLGRVRS